MLELAFNLPPPHAEKTSITSYAEQRVDPTETSFLKGNFNEEAWLSTIDLYCPAERVITLYPVNSAHSCASMVQLNGKLDIFGGRDGYVSCCIGVRSCYLVCDMNFVNFFIF